MLLLKLTLDIAHHVHVVPELMLYCLNLSTCKLTSKTSPTF